MIKITVRHSHRTNSIGGGGNNNNQKDQQQQQQQQIMTSEHQTEPNSIVEIKYRHSMNNMNSFNSNQQTSKLRRQQQEVEQQHQLIKVDKMSQSCHKDHRDRNHFKHLPHVKPRSAPRSVQHASQQQFQKARVGPRGSLSSCSSSSPELSGAEEAAEYYQTYLAASTNARFYENDHDDDDSQEYCSMQAANNSSVFDEPLAAPTNETSKSGRAHPEAAPRSQVLSGGGDEQQVNSKVATSIRATRANRNKLHARSVSLIVNPNFGLASGTAAAGESSDSDDEKATFKFTRRNSIVPSKLAAPSNRPNAVGRPSGEIKWPKMESNSGDRSVTKKEQHDKVIWPAECVEKTDETDSNVGRDQDQNARLREIGFILRQISDEFSRNRRLTI